MAAGGFELYATVWNCRTWKIQNVVNSGGSRSEAKLVRFAPSGTQLFVKGDFDIPGKIWRVHEGTVKCELEDDKFLTSDAGFSPDGRLVGTVGFEGIQLWDAETGRLLEKQRGNYNSVAISPDGKLMAVSSNWGTITLFKVNLTLVPPVASSRP